MPKLLNPNGRREANNSYNIRQYSSENCEPSSAPAPITITWLMVGVEKDAGEAQTLLPRSGALYKNANRARSDVHIGYLKPRR